MNRILARIENAHIILEPVLGNASDAELERLESDVYRLFSDKEVTAKHPEKRIKAVKEAGVWLARTLMGYELGTSFNHFLYLLDTREMIGVIEVIPSKALELMPSRREMFKSHPQLKGCVEVEYWLTKKYWGQKIMSNFLKNFTNLIILNGVPAVTAFVEADNLASIAVLRNSGFRKIGELRNMFKANTLHYIKTHQSL